MDSKPLLRGKKSISNGSGGITTTTVAIVALSVITIVGFALTITFGVLWGNARFPKTFSAATVPQEVNNFYKEVFERSYCGTDTYPVTPSVGVKLGWEPCYTKINTTTKLYFLDLEHPFEKFKKGLKSTHKSLLGSGQMTRAQEYVIKASFDVDGIWDKWTFKDTPQICQNYYRGVDFARLGLNNDWFADATPTTFRYISAPWYRTNYDTVIPMYGPSTVQIYLQEFESLKNMMIQARTGDFHKRQDAWLLANLGVHYALHYADSEVGSTIDGLRFLWNSTDFSGGSSTLYDNIIFKGAEAGYFLTTQEDSNIRQGITDVEKEMERYLNYLLSSFSTMTFYDAYAPANFPSGRPILSTDMKYARAMSNNVTEKCSGKTMFEGVWYKNALDEFNRFNQEWIVHHQAADAIFENLLPDYLGWNFLFVHLFFGTEAMVTDLGFYAPDDCPNGDIYDPAYAYTMDASNEGKSAYEFEMGGAYSKIQPMYLYFGNYFGGCDNNAGNAYVGYKWGDFKNRGATFQTIGPFQPREATWNIALHEHMHSKQISNSILSCPTCYFYQLSQLVSSSSEDIQSAIEGGATYAERNASTLDTRINIFGSNTLREAVFRLNQLNIRVDVFRSVLAIVSGSESVTAAALDYQANSPFFLLYFGGSLPLVENVFEMLSNSVGTYFFATQYGSGAHRYEQMKKKIEINCPNEPQAVLKVLDSQTALPAMPLSALEIAIDDYVATGCKKWPYEETNIF